MAGMEARADLHKEAAAMARMFDQVAPRYDLANDILTGGQVHVWRAAIADAVGARPGLRVLDLCCGTGTSAAAFARRGAIVSGCDISPGMIAEGRERHPELDLVEGDAMDLPFEDGAFDVATVSFGLRNVRDPEVALREMLRVTRPGGRVVIAEFSRPVPAWFREPYRAYITKVLPRIARLVSSDGVAYDYLYESILAWPAQEELAKTIRDAGWRQVAYRNLCLGAVAIHRGRRERINGV